MEAVRTADSHWLLHLLKETDVDHHQDDLDRAVHAAAWSGQADSVRMLLAAGASLYSVNQHGQPLLVEAVYSANTDVVRAILQVTPVESWQRTHAFLAVDESLSCRKFFNLKNAKFGVENLHLGKFKGKIEILSTHVGNLQLFV